MGLNMLRIPRSPSFSMSFHDGTLRVDVANDYGVIDQDLGRAFEFATSYPERMRLVEDILADSGLPSHIKLVERLKETKKELETLAEQHNILRCRLKQLVRGG